MLQFWFCRNSGLALPLIALQYHEVRIKVIFNPVAQLVICNSGFTTANNATITEATLLINYVYLDAEERRRFAQVGHEYLIEQVQFTNEESVENSSGKYRLNFNHPSKELIWAVKNGDWINGQSFLAYSGVDDGWTDAVQVAADRLLGSAIFVDGVSGAHDYYTPGVQVTNPIGVFIYSNSGAATQHSITLAFNAVGMTGPASGDYLHLQYNTYLTNTSYDLLNKINSATIEFGALSGSHSFITNVIVTDHDLTIRDISAPVAQASSLTVTGTRTGTGDNRIAQLGTYQTYNSSRRDLLVYQHQNYGLLLDGSYNPVVSALIQLNGQNRFDMREGQYFNYVEPEMRHTRTPVDGLMVYTFALHPEQHQPSGSCNFSRIDSTYLNLWYEDTSATAYGVSSSAPASRFMDSSTGTKLWIYAFSYNVLRIMSGMGGLAYAN